MCNRQDDRGTAGRFCGVVGGTLLLIRTRPLDEAVPPARRFARLAISLVLLALALAASEWIIATMPGVGVIATMGVSAALRASVVLVPAIALGGTGSLNPFRFTRP